MRILCAIVLVYVFSCHAEAVPIQDSVVSQLLDRWAFNALNIPQIETSGKKEVVVAIVDDGFRLSHSGLNGFVYVNKNEVPGNGIDDDNNGYIDDYMGWDISDNDADVSIPPDKYASMYHGTFVASLVTQIAQHGYTHQEQIQIKILPVKVLSDRSQSKILADGYRGIDYAIGRGADIICCAWSGGNPTSADHQIIQKALQKNILIIGAAGNMYQENVDSPASVTGVVAVAALDTLLRKTNSSGYGMEIDLSLPGAKVRAAYPLADNAWFYGEGTSAAAGLATGCAAVLKSLKPEALPWEITEALKNTAMPLDNLNPRYPGKLGSGLPDLSKAAGYLLNPGKRHTYFNSKRSEGSVYMGRKQKTNAVIQPHGAYASVVIVPDRIAKKDLKKQFAVYSNDSLCFKGTVQEAQKGIVIPGSYAALRPVTQNKRDFPSALKLNYYANTIDSTKLYCYGKVSVTATKGEITDGSSDSNYANYSSCVWQIIAPDDKHIRFHFTSFDTEANVDFVWLFDGENPLPENIIAKFSGHEIPPEVTSRTNRVYVWFVTDSKGTGKGWKLHFEGINSP